MFVIAGLGNPGKKYSRTRHNIGFMVVEEIARRNSIEFTDRKEYRIGRGSIEGHNVILLEPLLYMNRSGAPVREIAKKCNAQSFELIIIHDDLDMETGKLRIRKTGSSGGHKGVESIIQNIGSRDFIRVKIGIGREPGTAVEDYVLSKFSRQELSKIKEAIDRAAAAVHSVVADGVDKAMNSFN
ncbi:MAG TPA: aminoacyl-tRNA hydrolase [Thermodesulfovibrionales bacterium]|nr:aminoacyl-tRNA hydrolase [Thermodesulfovibrionales bacterium]